MSCIQKLAPQTARLLQSTQSIASVHSVVKELVENSLDAGASVIYVKLEDFGYEKIEVRDNGHGISESDLSQVVLPHHTSKITNFEDMRSLETYGFRGQGLAGIAAVSRVTIISGQKEKIGHSFTFDQQGKVVAQKELPWEGTQVTVDKLFKNVPVRRKHLSTSKNKSLDLKKVERLLSALGIAWPGVRLLLYHNKSLLWSRYPSQTFQEAVGQIFGMSMLDKMEYVEVEDCEREVTIKACLPKAEHGARELSSSDTDRMFLLVNRRHILSKELNEEAVHNLLETLLEKVYGNHITSKETNKENQGTVISQTLTNNKEGCKQTDARGKETSSFMPDPPVQQPGVRVDSASTSSERQPGAPADPTCRSTVSPPSVDPVNSTLAQNKTAQQNPSPLTPSGFFGWFSSPAAQGRDAARQRSGLPQGVRTSSPSDRMSSRKQLQFGTGKTGASWSLGLVENSQGRVVEPTVRIASGPKRTSSSPAGNVTPKKLRMPDLSQRRIFDLVPKEKSPMEVYCNRRKDEVLSQNPSMSIQDLSALLQDEWDGLTPAEKQQYEEDIRPRISDRASTANNASIDSRAGTKTARRKSALRKGVSATFSLSSIAAHYKDYSALSQTQAELDAGISVIGYSQEVEGWFVRCAASVYAINGFRLKEATLFKKLAESYALPMEPVYPPIELDKNSVGVSLWTMLTTLQQGTKDFTGASYITDSLLLSNGFELKLPSGANGDTAEVIQKASNVGIDELKEILRKISNHPSGCSLWDSRPAKIRFYLQGEAARMVQSGPSKLSLTDLWELIRQSEDCVSEQCMHSKPVCVNLFDLNSLQ
ncbi:PMS1 protein homolog 1-like isoform X2 [Ornithodoros turicata]|uniref:PMS1 protein homolog 1-like isoform X2 n=1 Tax=Ornithodoros turicata TaxID=34597 RepID=UPI003138A270